MREGFFSFYYAGELGAGFGLIALVQGVFVGVDVGGAFYDGTYNSVDDNSPLTGNLCLHVPANLELVTGSKPETAPLMLHFPLELPADFAISDLEYPVQTARGLVNIIIKKIRDLDFIENRAILNEKLGHSNKS